MELDNICEEYIEEIRQTYALTEKTYNQLKEQLSDAQPIITSFNTATQFLTNDRGRGQFGNIPIPGGKLGFNINNWIITNGTFSIGRQNEDTEIRTQIDALFRMSHIYLMSLFEAFNNDFIFFLFEKRPYIMKSKGKTISYDIILGNTIDLIRKEIAEIEVKKMKSNIDVFADQLKSEYRIVDIKREFSDWGKIREYYYRRNCVVHNGSKYDVDFCRNIKKKEIIIGERIEYTLNYIEACRNNLIKYINFLKDNLIPKYFKKKEKSSQDLNDFSKINPDFKDFFNIE